MMSVKVISRGISTSGVLYTAIKNIVIVGGGSMGSGIGQVAAQTGHTVTVVEVNDGALQKAKSSIEKSLQRVAKKLHQDNESEAKKFLSDTLSRLSLSLDLQGAVKQADLVIEAVPEKMEMKHQLFSTIDPISLSNTIFASNTSSLSIQEIASVTGRKDKFIGLHFFNPVPVMKLLEVVRTPETSDETYNKAMEWAKAIGKVPVTCKDTPGFIVNRLLVPFLGEAFRMLDRGDASARDIDTAMKLGAGHPMGPFELADYVGLDVTYFVLKGWHEKNPENPLFKPPPSLERLVNEGKLGVKTGEGIYTYKK